MKNNINLLLLAQNDEELKHFYDVWEHLGLFDSVKETLIAGPVSEKIIPKSKVFSTVTLSPEEYCPSPLNKLIYEGWKSNTEYLLYLNIYTAPPGKNEGLIYESATAFLEDHEKYLNDKKAWYNPYTNIHPRGLPYLRTQRSKSKNMINCGLIMENLDIDPIQQIVFRGKKEAKFSYTNSLVPQNYFFPFTWHNVMWKRDISLLLGTFELGTNWAYADIWTGIMLKKILDSLNYNVSVGMPYVKNDLYQYIEEFPRLKTELESMHLNEFFWKKIESFHLSSDSSLMQAYLLLAGKLINQKEKELVNLGGNMIQWAKLFKE